MAGKQISFPGMGWSKIAFKALIGNIPGWEVVEPPTVTREVIELGARYSPEFVCFPFKVTLGEFIYMRKYWGVSTFVQAIDCGPCRFGFYAPIQERIMHDMGYDDVRIIPIQQADLTTLEFIKTFDEITSVTTPVKYVNYVRAIRHFLLKTKHLEEILRIDALLRARELHKGDTTKAMNKLMDLLDKTNNDLDLHRFPKVIHEVFREVSIDMEKRPLRVLVTGENHVLLEPFVNLDLVRKLGEMGIEVHWGSSLYDWITHKLHINFRRKELERLAKPYCPMDIGGEAVWVLGEYVKCQEEGFDGFVHVYPFTCMPEVSARAIIEAAPEFKMPAIFFSFDEQTGTEGMRTRLEAFQDLMNQRREIYGDRYVMPEEIKKLHEPPKSWGVLDFLAPYANALTDIVSNLIGTGTRK